MSFLAAMAAFAGVIAVLNLLLTFGVIRRLREHTELLARAPGTSPGDGPISVLRVGEPAGAFTTTTLEGATVSQEQLSPGTLIGFFMPGCEPCTVEMPKFVEAARTRQEGRRAVAVIAASDPTDVPAAMRDALAAVADVVIEGHHGAMVEAFGVGGYPAVCQLDQDLLIRKVSLPTPALADGGTAR